MQMSAHRREYVEPKDLADLYKQLPFFNQKILYPDYEPSLAQYRKEAERLIDYLKLKNLKGWNYDKKILTFQVKSRWLRGEEYGFLLRHYKTYIALGIIKVNFRQ